MRLLLVCDWLISVVLWLDYVLPTVRSESAEGTRRSEGGSEGRMQDVGFGDGWEKRGSFDDAWTTVDDDDSEKYVTCAIEMDLFRDAAKRS
jgi:hypothetical protein